MSDEKKDILSELKTLDELTGKLDGFSDMFDEGLDGITGIGEAMSGFNPGAGAFPQGIGGFAMPGMPKDVALYDTVVVHGLRGDYRLSFEESEEGLVIKVAGGEVV